MGIDISAGIVVGLPREELEDHPDFGDFEDGELDSFSPYYDGWEDAIFGYSVVTTNDDSAIELSTIDDKLESAKIKFKDKTGQDGKVYLTPIVY